MIAPDMPDLDHFHKRLAAENWRCTCGEINDSEPCSRCGAIRILEFRSTDIHALLSYVAHLEALWEAGMYRDEYGYWVCRFCEGENEKRNEIIHRVGCALAAFEAAMKDDEERDD